MQMLIHKCNGGNAQIGGIMIFVIMPLIIHASMYNYIIVNYDFRIPLMNFVAQKSS